MSDIDYVNESLKKLILSNNSEEIEESTSKLTWNEIVSEFDIKREELENYIKKRDGIEEKVTLAQHPVIAYLNETVFPLLCQGLIELLEKIREERSCYRQKSAFNGIDFLSEYLYNMNARYPKRRENWTYIFDMEWVQKHLEESPRPYYPFSLIWSNEYAALKIQSYVRGYWTRRRPEVLEMRHFWKDYKNSRNKEEATYYGGSNP